MRKELSILFLLLFISINFINAASLDLVKSVNKTSANIGDDFTYTLQYRCASTTNDCNGVMITDPLPASVEYRGLSGSIHTTNESYDPITHTVTFTFVDPLVAGTVGQVTITVRFPNNITPNGTTVTNTATMSASNAPSVNSTSQTTTAVAVDKIVISKSFRGGVVDEKSIYTVVVSNGGFNALRADNITITDPLPPNVTFVSASNGGTYNASTNTVTWTVGSLNKDSRATRIVTIIFPSSNYTVGDNITNTATVTYTPVGESQKSKSASVLHQIQLPFFGAELRKVGSGPYQIGNANETHKFNFTNTSNVPIANFYLEDLFPDGLRPRMFETGNFSSTDPSANLNKTVSYITNLNATWTAIGGISSNLGTNQNVNTSSLGLAANEYIIGLRWAIGPDPLPIGSGLVSGDLDITYEQIPSNAPIGSITNCVTVNGSNITTFNYFQNQNCDNSQITPALQGYVQSVEKEQRKQGTGNYEDNDGPTFNTGEVVQFRLKIRNGAIASSPIPSPAIADLLPEGLKYIDSSWSFDPGTSSATTPTFVKIDNYKGTTKTYLRWNFNGYNLQPDEQAFIVFSAQITPKAGSGDNAIRNEYAMLSPLINFCGITGDGVRKVDTEDINNNGNTTEELCFGYSSVDIRTVPALSSEKFVKGQLDTEFTKFPEFGNAVPGGVADYKLIIRNDGNVPIKEIKVVDILPFVGDAGVIDLSPRNTRWRPNLAGAVSAPPGVIVYYSTEGNPCRDAEGIEPNGPAGCQPPNWTTSVPADITTVQSLKFDFGTFVLEPADSIVLEWPMRAPVNTLQSIGNISDTIAWASFGYVGTRADNDATLLAAEPLKVGIRLEQFVPAVLGDKVFLDLNLNGIQDNNEGGLDGVKVELYRDNGDGIADANQDILEAFTITGNDGFYLFPNLDADNYFLVFYIPPNYDITIANAGSDDAIDSDATLTTVDGFKAAITSVINLNAMAIDLDQDLGIYPNNKTSIGNYVFIDDNEDGVQNESANFGVNGLTVNLYQSSNLSTPFLTTTTTDDLNGKPGFYIFRDIAPGGYQIELVLPNGVTATTRGAIGIADPTDSDIDANGRTEVFTFFANQYDDTWDMGIIVSGTEICNNLVDDDGDGYVDCEDTDCDTPQVGPIIFD